MEEPIIEPALLDTIAEAVETAGGTIPSRDTHSLRGTLTAIKAHWFLGGRKVLDRVTCRLIPEAHEVRLRETATEASWGLPPPRFMVETTTQSGARVTSTRDDTGIGGGGCLEFGRFRDAVDRAAREAGWRFVYEVP